MMNKAEALEKFRDFLESEFDIPREKVLLTASLYEDLELDSIDAIDLISWLATLTGERMAPKDFFDARTVEDLLNVLHDKNILDA